MKRPFRFQKTATSGSMSDSTAETVKSFKDYGVCDTLCETISRLGWKTPSPIQAECLKYAFEDRDIIGLAETGSGKTGAFAIPVIQRLINNPQRLYAVVVTPTRELAIQIADQFEALGASVGLKTACILGGVDMVTQAIALAKKPHVIICTPGSSGEYEGRCHWLPSRIGILAALHQVPDSG